MAPVKNPVLSSSQFRLLRTVDESFELMLKAISEAENSIRLEMYIYTASPIGERFREALIQARGRGVFVRILVDSWGSITLSDQFWDPLRAVGGQFRWFNPLSLDRYGIRNHRKLLVCDDRIAFVGGFNIAAEYQGDGVTRGWHDLGLQVHGGLAKELAMSFETLFGLADFQHKRFVRLRKARLQNLISTQDGQILMTGPGRGKNFLKHALLNDWAKAKSIRLISAYFLPHRPLRRALAQAARRGASVQIILPAKSDVPLSQFASRRFYQSFLRSGIEIYEYQPQILHAKLFVIGDVVYAGSANLDRRSLFINYELMLRLANPELAAEAHEVFEEDLKHCRKIDAATWKKSRTFWNKLKENWAFFLLARIDPLIARRQLRNLR
jgi:cardiolipin synthase